MSPSLSVSSRASRVEGLLVVASQKAAVGQPVRLELAGAALLRQEPLGDPHPGCGERRVVDQFFQGGVHRQARVERQVIGSPPGGVDLREERDEAFLPGADPFPQQALDRGVTGREQACEGIVALVQRPRPLLPGHGTQQQVAGDRRGGPEGESGPAAGDDAGDELVSSSGIPTASRQTCSRGRRVTAQPSWWVV